MLPSSDLLLFRLLAARPDAQIDLVEGALLIATMERPDLSMEEETRRLDDLAAIVARHLEPGASPDEILPTLLEVLYGDLGFRGNTTDYYDPANSFLDAVLTRRTGIPISLAVVLSAVATRVGLPLEGVAFPAHFLVRCAGASAPLYVDPFSGRQLARADLLALARRAFGRDVPLRPVWLEPASPRLILFRMLSNLRAIYLERGLPARLGPVVERMLLLSPTPELRDELRKLGGPTLWPSANTASA